MFSTIKKSSFFLAIILLMSSCKYFNGYTIDGKIQNGEKTIVYLEDISGEVPEVIDTVSIHNNAFELKNYSTKGIYRLRFGDDIYQAIYLYIEPKAHLKIEADLKQLQNYKATGNKASVSIQQFSKNVHTHIDGLDASYKSVRTATPATKDSLSVLFDIKKKEYISFVKKFIEEEPNNDVACFALSYLGPIMQDEVAYLVEVVDRLHKASPDSKYIDGWYKQTQQYRDAVVAENEGGVALNSMAPNIALRNTNGDTVELKSLQGNYVLLDFWASWCGPCRAENPNVVELYKKYHDKGFEVFSVSLDTNTDQWKKAIEKDGLIWKSHVSDLIGWNSSAAQLYHVQSIPNTFLIDKTGKVIAKNLRGQALASKLAELFAEKTVQ